jgi:hypothetical protein
MADPVQALTGYKGGADASGKGGRTREATNMARVDAMAGGNSSDHPAASNPTYPTQTKPAPSSYAPSDDGGPRVYGQAPVSTPILRGGK